MHEEFIRGTVDSCLEALRAKLDAADAVSELTWLILLLCATVVCIPLFRLTYIYIHTPV